MQDEVPTIEDLLIAVSGCASIAWIEDSVWRCQKPIQKFDRDAAERFIQAFVDLKVAEALNIRPIEEAPKDGSTITAFVPDKGWRDMRWFNPGRIRPRWISCAYVGGIEGSAVPLPQPTHFIPSLPTPTETKQENHNGN